MRRHAERFRGESGFMLVWSAIIILPLLTLGLVLLGYGRANVAKLRAQFNAINLASIGVLSSEFKPHSTTETSETLNSMAMLASAQGFTGVRPNETVQDLSSGLIIFKHNVESPGENKVAVYQKYTLAAIDSLVSDFSQVKTSGVAQMRPSKLYISVVLDYSRSLLADGSISDLLKAFRVINPLNPDQAGPNGVEGSQPVEPKGYAQNALPFGVGSPRFHYGWNVVGPVYPNFNWTAPALECTPGPENDCGAGTPTHAGAIAHAMTNHFMMYKRAATVLVGVMAQMSRYLDVSVLGAPLPPEHWSNFISLTQGGDANDPGEKFETLSPDDNDPEKGGGIFPAWRYDEATVSGLGLNPPTAAPPLLRGQIDYTYSFDNPKSPLTENMTLSPTRVLLFNLAVWPRKSARYLVYTDENGKSYSFSSTDPPFPVETRIPTGEKYFLPAIPSDVEDPGDSFPYDPGTPDSNGWVQNDVMFGFGWPWGPTPFLHLKGLAHPKMSEFPAELAEVYEYTRNGSGPQTENLAPLSKDKWKTGYGLCVMLDELEDEKGVIDGWCKDPDAPFDDKKKFYFYDKFDPPRAHPTDDMPTSPRCDTVAGIPACVTGNPATLITDNFVWCIHGYPRCVPGTLFSVRCVDPTTHAVVPGEVICEGAGGPDQKRYPPGYDDEPRHRGSVRMSDSPPDIEKANLFYFLMDLLPTYGGSFHHNMVPNDRCEAFLERTDGAGRCAGVFVTDGVPRGTGFSGQPLIPDTATETGKEKIFNLLEERMDRFTEDNDARSFTWYLGKKGPLDKVIEAARVQNLDDRQKELIDLLASEPPDRLDHDQCDVFDSIPGRGVTCSHLNSYILPLNRVETEDFGRFKTIMGGGAETPRRKWVEAELTSNADGVTGLGEDNPTDNSVIKSLRGLLAKIKGARVLDK